LSPVHPGLQGLVAHLVALAGQAEGHELLELRYRRTSGGMGQRFFPVARPDAAATAAFTLGRRTDVYLGACPRARREGTRDAITWAWTLWADLDGPAAVEALKSFAPAPAIVVRSGTANNCHAYWPLAAPLAPDALEQANRRLATALGADLASIDAARVLRPPGTLNFKTDPPALVAVEAFTGERFNTWELLACLPALEPASGPRRAQAPRRAPRRVDDPLRILEPAVYVAALTGQKVTRDRKVSCPFHRDRTPSLHVYETPEDGWFCFGCRCGGTVYDLGAGVFGLSTRGREFVQLRGRLYEALLPGHEPPTAPRRRRRARMPA